MILIVLCFVFLPFTVLATPITSGVAEKLTLDDFNKSIRDVRLAKYCPPPPPDATPISFGFEKIGFIGWIETDSLTICLDVNAIFQLTHCYGSLRDSESVECGFDEWLAKGDIKLYIKNEYELWLHLEGTIFKKSWNKDIHILDLPHNQGVGNMATSTSYLVSPATMTDSASIQLPVSYGNSSVSSASPTASSMAPFQALTRPVLSTGVETS